MDDRYSTHPLSWPSLPSWTQAEVSSSSRVMGAFVCIPGLLLCCFSGQTVSVCESWRHITSASSSEGQQVISCGERVIMGKGWGWAAANEHTLLPRITGTQNPRGRRRRRRSGTDTLHLRKTECVWGGCYSNWRASLASGLLLDTGMVKNVGFW